MKNETLVIGASLKSDRYSNKAILKLRANNIEVKALGVEEGKVLDVEISKDKLPYSNIDTVTLYVNPKIQKNYYEYVVSLKPRRVIFNPGTENAEFEKILNENSIATEIACTLVLLSTHQY